MDKQIDAYTFFVEKKSTKGVVENFIDTFQPIYESLEGNQQILLAQCIQQMFRKYYYTELVPDTVYTPANIINTLAERELGRDNMVLPLIKVGCSKKRIKKIECTTLRFNIENHYFLKDMELFIERAYQGIPLTDIGIPEDDSRIDLGRGLTIDDRHYINIISMAALEMGLLEKITSVKGNIYRPGDKADKFLQLGSKEKIMLVADALVSLCSRSIIEVFPFLREEFSRTAIKNMLKKPGLFDDLFIGIMEKFNIDVFSLSKRLLEMDPDKGPELSEHEFSDIKDLFAIKSLIDMYFAVPFGYYLQLIQPIYPGIYHVETEAMNILQYADDFIGARNSLFMTMGCSYDLTPLGEDLLVSGRKPKRQQLITQNTDDDEMYKVIMENRGYQEEEDNWGDEDGEIWDDEDEDENENEDENCDNDLLNVINIFDYLNTKEGGKKGRVNKPVGCKLKPNPGLDDKVFVFKAKLFNKKRVWRQIEITGSNTLDDLHKWIYESFNLEYGHLYSFFMSNKAWDRDSEFCHPESDGSPASEAKISSLNLSPKQKFMYIYDYGDEHKFEVELIDIKDRDDDVKYPHLAKCNKPTITVCDECKSSDRPIEWYCCDHEEYLCSDCADSKKHEECYITRANI